MENNILELVFILDRSGSMHGLEKDTVGGFNSMIEKQKQLEGKVFVSTVLFNDKHKLLHDRKLIDEIEPMKESEYETYGCTALLDAVGNSIIHISNIHKYLRKEDVPSKVMFVITTDGLENASNEFNKKTVKKMIEDKQREGWEFLFVGANIDAVETAEDYGINTDNAVNYHADAKGTGVLYDTVESAIKHYRTKGQINKNWSKSIKDDFEKRKK